mmetsp:Transcript_10345/g.26250  ORF Transcript_10345/g.26250 Transcript_10345/m.26250 type:complete len:221 (-) Transcript_10345:909-1571(-)
MSFIRKYSVPKLSKNIRMKDMSKNCLNLWLISLSTFWSRECSLRTGKAFAFRDGSPRSSTMPSKPSSSSFWSLIYIPKGLDPYRWYTRVALALWYTEGDGSTGLLYSEPKSFPIGEDTSPVPIPVPPTVGVASLMSPSPSLLVPILMLMSPPPMKLLAFTSGPAPSGFEMGISSVVSAVRSSSSSFLSGCTMDLYAFISSKIKLETIRKYTQGRRKTICE